jgi:hypothetical protein
MSSNTVGSNPVITNVTPGVGQLTVDFTQDDPGFPSPEYFYSLDAGTTLLGTATSSSPVIIDGITDDMLSNYSLEFWIVANNDAGKAISDASSGIPYQTGTEVTISNITPILNGTIVDFYQDFSGNPAPTYYYTFDNGATLLGDASSSPITIDVSDNVHSFDFRIYATNVAGYLMSDDSSGITYYTGSAVTIDTVTPISTGLTVNFTQTDAGNPAPTYYYSLDGTTPLGTGVASSPLTIDGLTEDMLSNHSLDFYIIADSSAGSVVSDISAGSPYMPGTALTISNTTPIVNGVTIDFYQDYSGNPEPTYYYTLDGSSTLLGDASSSPITIYNNQPFNYRIHAVNAGGSVISDSSSAVPYYTGSDVTIDTVTPISNGLTVDFSQTDSGNPAPTYYYSFDGTTPLGTGVLSSPIDISGLTYDTLTNGSKQFYIIASNTAGDVVSDISSGVPLTTGSPVIISSVVPGKRSLTVNFNQTYVGNTPTSYYYSLDNGTTLLGSATAFSPLIIGGLTENILSNHLLDFCIVANNSAGKVVSDASSGSPYMPGSALTVSTVTSIVNGVTVDFYQDYSGNPAPTYYYTLNGGTTLLGDASSSPITISGTNAFNFWVYASNAGGNLISSRLTGRPYYTGSDVIINKVTPIENGLSVRFTQTDPGYSAPTYYYSFDGTTPLGTGTSSSPIDISGLTYDGSATQFYIISSNAGGDVVSDISSGTPLTTGAPVIIDSVIPGTNNLTVYFSQSYGGNPAPKYYYSFDSGTTLLGNGTTSSPITIGGILGGMLSNSALDFYIVANNSIGKVVSDISSGTPIIDPTVINIANITPIANGVVVDFYHDYTGSAPTYYYSFDAGTTPLGNGVSSSPITIDVSDNVHSFSFWIYATNDNGVVISDELTGDTYYTGSTVTIDSVVPTANGLTVEFTQTDAGNPAPTYYYSFDGTTPLGSGVTSSPIDISGLSDFQELYIISSNTAGDVVSDISSGTPLTTGSAVSIDNVVPGTNKLTVNFTQSSGGNPAPTYYYSFDGTTLLGPGVASSPIDISGLTYDALTNNSQDFYIISANSAGKVVSDISSGTPLTTGSPVSVDRIIPGSNSLTVYFTQNNVGNSSPTYYYSLNGTTVLGSGVSSSPLTISDISYNMLQQDGNLQFYIVASNDAGNVVSAQSQERPFSIGSPLTVRATSGANQLVVDFSQNVVGNPLPKYYYSFNGTTLLGDGSNASQIIIPNLQETTTFYIIATNYVGNVVSSPVTETPYYAGSEITVTNVTSGYGKVTVQFTQSDPGYPLPTYYYSLDGVNTLGAGTSSSPLTVNEITNYMLSNGRFDFYIIAVNDSSTRVYSSLAYGTPTLFNLNDISGNTINVAFQIPTPSDWISQYSNNCSQILYLQGPPSSSPLGYEYVSAFVNYSGTITVESCTAGGSVVSSSFSILDVSTARFPDDTLYICSAIINTFGRIGITVYYYLTSNRTWTLLGRFVSNSIATTYSDWNIFRIGYGSSNFAGGDPVYSQLRINNAEIYPINGNWFWFYKLYLVDSLGSGAGQLLNSIYTFNYAEIHSNLPVVTQINGSMVSGIVANSNSRYVALNPGNSYTTQSDFNYLTINTYTISHPTNATNDSKIPCFGEGSRILCFNRETFEEEYVEIQNIRKGTLVKTLRHDYVPVYMIGKTTMQNKVKRGERKKENLYKCTKRNYPEMINQDLILTGCHCILVEEFKDDEERENTSAVNKGIYITDNKYRLPACVDERAQLYEKSGTFTIYHLALENDDYYMNYGIYANGLLVETSSKRYMRELSNMEML